MNNRKIAPPMVGLSSLLVIFAVLCLTVFAVLSLSTVRADRRRPGRGPASEDRGDPIRQRHRPRPKRWRRRQRRP